jgi:hypothetical protein
MPTHTHIFDNRRNGYGHLNTAYVRSSTVAEILLMEGPEDLLLSKLALLSLLIM